MKKQINIWGLVLTLTLLGPASAVCQGMPVYDNTNFISLTKSLVESAKQTSQLLQTVAFLKQQKENLEKVTRVVQQLHAVKEIAKSNERLFGMVQNDLSAILNSPYIKIEELTKITDSFTQLLDNSLATAEFVEEILSSDYLKMSDAERTEILKTKEREAKEMLSISRLKMKRYQDIISFRRMQDLINHRATNY
tara:strand:- start:6490 stop:7071 length:582 start_codon:yes stop_codon:yes gene_type:complete